MTSVDVYDHHPTAHELLDVRLSWGWMPTPSDLQDGDRVLGYASCIFEGK